MHYVKWIGNSLSEVQYACKYILVILQMSKKLLQKIVLNTKVEHYIKQKEWWF